MLYSDIEDEYHFVIVCKCYTVIRKKYIKQYYNVKPSVFKFTQLLTSCNKTDINNLCKFVKDALNYRNTHNLVNN